MDLSSVVNTDLYPIDRDVDDDDYVKQIAKIRSQIIRDGIATLPGFFRAECIPKVTDEVALKADKAFVATKEHNVYLDEGDDYFPKDHIRNRRFGTKVGSLAYDYISRGSPLLTLYNHDGFCNFLRGALDQPQLYRLADPFGACSINILKSGWWDGWHFDESKFTTTLLLQKPEVGGEFQMTRPFRRTRGEAREADQQKENRHYELVESIVGEGDDSVAPPQTRALALEPGTLSIFQGSQCLHRVSKCGGNRDRMVAVLCFATQPGVRNSPKVQKLFWGRSEHLEA